MEFTFLSKDRGGKAYENLLISNQFICDSAHEKNMGQFQ
jgi:hypothetical protein